jgi:hypothetical protein
VFTSTDHVKLGVWFVAEWAGKRFGVTLFATLYGFCAMVNPIIDEASNSYALSDGGFVALVPCPGVHKSEVDPFDGRGVQRGAPGKVAAVQVCLMTFVLYQRNGGVNDGKTVMSYHPLGVFKDV